MKIEVGTRPPESGLKDAIHVPVVSVFAGEANLAPGQAVRINRDGDAVAADSMAEAVGVVDPFLSAPVNYAQSFWLCLKPGSVENLSHTWTHPSFPTPFNQNDSYDDGCRGCFS